MNSIHARKRIIFVVVMLTFSGLCMTQPLRTSQRDSLPDMRIKLQVFTFDPLRQMPKVDEQLLLRATPREVAFRLIQFKGSLTQKQMELLKTQYKLKLDTYFPSFTYLEKLSLEQVDNLRRLPFFRWSGNYEPAYKISPTIGAMRFRTPERQQMKGLLLRVLLFAGANISDFLDALRQVGASEIRRLDNNRTGGDARFQFVLTTKDSLPRIAERVDVRWIEEIAEINEDNVNTAGTIQSGTPGNETVWDHGIHGENQILGIIDSAPLDINHCFFLDPVNNTPRSGHRKVIEIRNASGSAAGGHATFTAGNAAGDDFNNPGGDNRRGGAWASRLVSGNNNDITSGLSTMLAELNSAALRGATIHTNSWHENTAGAGNAATYNQTASDVDDFSWNNEDHLVLGSAGNTGEEQGPPGTAKDAICVGASQADPNEMNFGDGNNGPTSDGRRKPDIVTPGCGVQSATVGTACGTGPRSACATSYATPHTAAAAALIRQYFTEGWYPSGTKQPHNAFVPSGALIKAVLLNSTLDMTGIAGYPGNQEGWGLIRLDNVVFFPGSLRNLWAWDVRNSNGLFTGSSSNYTLNVASNTTPLKITLVWTDPPAPAGSAAPLTNDLDLTVTAPNGDVFRGNDFTNGQSTVNGTTFDNLNNVEMVLVNTPQVGQFAIQVNGTSVNQGNPGQGYALVATADTEDPPSPIGTQNTLVVRTGLSDIAAGAAPSPTAAINLMTAVGNYISEVSYGSTTINAQFVETSLGQPSSYYYHPSRNVLIEMAQEVITNLVTANPNIFTQGTATTSDDIARLVILTNDPSFVGDWATTGGWSYDLPGGLTRRISVSVNSIHNDAEKRLEHALCHQFGLLDLYAYPNVVFAQPHVDDWDIMANVLNDVHPMAWSKERALWITTHDPNNILFIPRPTTGSSANQTVSLDFVSSTGTTHKKAIAIGLTPNVTAVANERVFYFVEARSDAAGSRDSNVPEEGVLLYYVNEDIKQGEGPARIIDDVVSTNTLTDAALEVGDSQSPSGTGLTVTVQTGTGGAAYDVQISYTPPATDNDVNIIVGDPAYTSPDIWVDSQKDGFDKENGRTEQDRGDQPAIGEVNRIYFNIHNPGPGNAYDVSVFVRVSEPYHTVGGTADFNSFVGQKFYSQFTTGTDITDYVEWTPNDDGDNHSCVWVEIPNVFNDVNTYNNAAQQNTEEVRSSHSSPYETIVYHFGVTNPYDYQQLTYFKTEGLPQGWTGIVNPQKALMSSHERIEGTLTIQPPDNAQACTEHRIELTSWMPRGNTLVPLGGGTVQVDLRNRTDISINTNVELCDQKRHYTPTAIAELQKPGCAAIGTAGCTNPARPNEEIIIRYQDPNGNPVYHTVLTDENGCYSDTYVVTDGGNWRVSAEYPGNDCSGSVSTGKTDVGVPLSPSGSAVQRSAFLYSFHVGSAHPIGTSDTTADANVHVSVDLTYRWKDRINAKFYLGLNQFTEESFTGISHPRWVNASLDIQVVFPTPSGLQLYAQVGPGNYWPKSGPSKVGFNVGVGGEMSIGGPFALVFGTDYHQIQTGNRTTFFTAQLGIIFK